jgi:hypothetical protein
MLAHKYFFWAWSVRRCFCRLLFDCSICGDWPGRLEGLRCFSVVPLPCSTLLRLNRSLTRRAARRRSEGLQLGRLGYRRRQFFLTSLQVNGSFQGFGARCPPRAARLGSLWLYDSWRWGLARVGPPFGNARTRFLLTSGRCGLGNPPFSDPCPWRRFGCAGNARFSFRQDQLRLHNLFPGKSCLFFGASSDRFGFLATTPRQAGLLFSQDQSTFDFCEPEARLLKFPNQLLRYSLVSGRSHKGSRLFLCGVLLAGFGPAAAQRAVEFNHA